MTPKQFTHWISRVYDTRENELDCHQTQLLLPAYVEAEFHGNPFETSASIEVHLRQCPSCLEIYRALYDLVELEAEHGELPAVEEEIGLPTVPPQSPVGDFIPVAAD